MNDQHLDLVAEVGLVTFSDSQSSFDDSFKSLFNVSFLQDGCNMHYMRYYIKITANTLKHNSIKLLRN